MRPSSTSLHKVAPPTILNMPPGRVAWFTLLGAFFILVSLTLGTLVAARWYVFSSTVDLNTQVRVGRGTVGIRNLSDNSQEAVRINRFIGRNQSVTTDEVAQGYIQFVDTSDGDRVIANVFFLPGSQVQVLSATRPRFGFSDAAYQIKLGNFQGRLEIEIPSGLNKAMQLTVHSSQGIVTLTQSGLYLIWSLADSTTLIPRTGTAQIAPYNGQNLDVPPGQTATIDGVQQTITIAPTTDELIQNSLFDQATEAGVPDAWGCYSTAELADAPRGAWTLQTFEGSRALWIHRPGPLSGSGETGCRQYLGQRQAGLDVTGYRTLRIRATMNLLWHSLSVCGTQASECPLMLEVTYLNEIGIEQRWIHGFYGFEHGSDDMPTTCNSCLIDHDRITPGNWYSYESGNLFNLPLGFRPTKLLQVRFYVSGHEYETAVAEISILAER